MRNLYSQQETGVFGSIVAGKNSFQGRVWDHTTERFVTLGNLVIVGESVRTIPLTGHSSGVNSSAVEIFDRGLALTNGMSLGVLSQMRVAVVGSSGTGSLTTELLLRCGVGEIVLFDFDKSDVTNLNRVLHLRRQDTDNKTFKSVRLKEALDDVNLPTKITVVPGGDVRDMIVAQELRGCDAILGCVDNSDWARLVMTEVAYQYLIPYIDIGTEIGIDNERVQSLDTRTSFSGPNRPCLICSGLIDPEQVRLEGLTTAEAQRVHAMGYTKQRQITAPAVMDLNMRAASYGVLVLRHLLQPFLDVPIPTHIKESVTNFSVRKIRKEVDRECPICGSNSRVGLGDGRPLTVRRE